MPLPGPTHIPPIGEQTDPDKVRVAAVIGGQLASAPARGFGLTPQELGNLQAITAGYSTTAQTRNRIVNGAMQISQENGNSIGSTNTYYCADQFSMVLFVSGAVMNMQRVPALTPNGSINRFRTFVNTADTSLAATDQVQINHRIEGGRVADFRYGTASAKQVILRFGWKSPAGTYCVSIRNAADNRTYLAPFTIAAGQANTDTEQTFVIPGDITGTWLTDTGVGFQISWTLACGTTYIGATGWQAGVFLGTSAITNNIAIASAICELYDVGLYLDPDATGLPPKWTMPDEAEELRACMRYWQIFTNLIVDSGTYSQTTTFQTPMRITPAASGGGAGFLAASTYPTHGHYYQTTRNYQTIILSARM